MIYMQKGDTTKALNYYYEGIRSGAAQNNLDGLVRGYRDLARYLCDEAQQGFKSLLCNETTGHSKNWEAFQHLDII